MQTRFRNWAGTVEATPSAVHRPESEADLARLLAESTGRVKVVGSAHSWSAIAQPVEQMVLLDRLDRFLHLDRDRQLATVQAGIPLHRLVEELAVRGYALKNVGSILEQTLSGAISTGTHGSGIGKGNLASQVTALRLVDAAGVVHACSAQQAPDLWRAARVGLGALGVISELTVSVQPLFKLEEKLWPLSFDAMVETLPELVQEWPFIKVWWLPHTDVAAVFAARPTEDPVDDPPWKRRLDHWINAWVFPPLLGLSRIDGRFAPPLNRVVAAAYFRDRRRVNRMDRILAVSMPPIHRETEYSVPFDAAQEAVRQTRALIEERQLHVNFPVEVRFVKGDDAWLSPAHGRDSCQIGAYQAESRSLQPWFSGFADRMMALDGRPHWGKEIPTAPDLIRPRYPRFSDFLSLRERLDPNRRFTNPFLDRLLG